jgi:hypothetical protein
MTSDRQVAHHPWGPFLPLTLDSGNNIVSLRGTQSVAQGMVLEVEEGRMQHCSPSC